ncbi:MAG: AAA family ATPase, partial [Muribaculaceae bacterium]
MIDKRNIEFVLTDQQDEIGRKASEKLCNRDEVRLVDLSSTQAQVVIGVRRSGKSTLCYQALKKENVKFAYADFDDERL